MSDEDLIKKLIEVKRDKGRFQKEYHGMPPTTC